MLVTFGNALHCIATAWFGDQHVIALCFHCFVHTVVVHT